jgi:hypothetical protein
VLGVGVRVGRGLGHAGHRHRGLELGLGGADRGGLRVGVDHVRDGLVAGLAVLAQDVRGHHLALVLADVGQQPDAGYVADGPQAVGQPAVAVHRDPVSPGGDPHRVQAIGDPGRPAGGHQQLVAAQFGAVVQGQHVVLAVVPGRGGLLAQVQLDAVLAEFNAEGVTERLGLAGQHVR